MQFEVWAKGLVTLNVDCVVLGIFEDGELGVAHAATTLRRRPPDWVRNRNPVQPATSKAAGSSTRSPSLRGSTRISWLA